MPIRETFWNIPRWAEYSNYLLALLTVIVFAYGVWRRSREWMKGKPAQRLDRPVERIVGVIQHAIFLLRTEAQAYPGLMHRTLFWGMAFLFTGTALATLDWDVTRLIFDFQFLKGVIYVTYELVLDFFGLVVLVGLSMAAYRRYVLRPQRLTNSLSARFATDDAYALIVLLVIVVTGFVLEALRLAILQPSWARWSPVGYVMAGWFAPLGEQTNRSLHVGVWMFHMLLVFGAIAAIPYTKFFHIITSPMNVFLRKLGPPGALDPIVNIEEAETFGAGKVEDWTWKRLLDFEACTRCGRCQDVCPATTTGKPLSPQNIIIKLGGYLSETPLVTGKKDATMRSMHGDVISADELWDCTTCAACVQACPVFIDQLGAIVEMRRYLTMSEGNVSRNLNMALTGMEQNGNPYGLARAQRADWAKDLGVKTMAETGGDVDVLYWVGCAASYDDRNKRVARAFVKVLQAAGVKFAILGTEESCTGDSARRAGNEYLFQTLAQENIETLNRYKVKRIVTACPHCFHTIKDEYPQFGGSYEVVHHSQMIADLLAQRKLKLSEADGAGSMTYHEPCYLGRHNGVYQPARDVIRTATGQAVIEMPRNHANSFCCGAGGARNWMEENRGSRINQNRAAEAVASEASALAVACPFCMGMMADGLKARAAGGSRRMEIRDIAEVVAERLGA